MPRMTDEEMTAFLNRPLIAVFSSSRPDGTLHSTPVWYEHDNGTFYFWVDRHSVKGRNVTRNPEVSVCIATTSEPYQYVSLSGACRITTEDMASRCLSIARRYYDEQRARAFVQEDLSASPSMLLVLQPRRLTSERSA